MSVVLRSGDSANEATINSSGELKVAISSGITVDSEFPAAAALADATANPTTTVVAAANEVFNGTTWDRSKAATAAAGTTGTGVPAAGALGYDGTNYQRVKTDSAGVVQTAFAATPAVTISGTPAVTADTELPAAAALADATANPTTPLVGAANEVYNGASWDRAKAATAAANTTGTGVPAAGVLGHDGANYQRMKTDSSGVVQTAFAATPAVTISGTAAVSGTVTADTELPAAAALADATTNPTTSIVGAANESYNGTTWDRQRTANIAAGTTGLGVPAAGVVGFDGTNYQRVKVDSAGVVQTAFAATPAVTVSGTATISGSVTADTELPAAIALSDSFANPTTPVVGAAGAAWNGSFWERSRTVAAADGTTGGGVPAAGIMGYDGTNYQAVKTDTLGTVAVATRGAAVTGTSGAIAAAGTGTIGPLDVSAAGNITFIAKNTTAASAWAGAPVLVFEQSDDSTSWGPLTVVRSDTNAAGSTTTLGANVANGSIMFDAGLEGVNYVRVRVTTGPTTNGMTIVLQPGGGAFSPVVATVVNNPGGVTSNGPTSVTAAVADTLLLAANGNRRGAAFTNDSTAVLYLSLGTAAASTTAFTAKLAAAAYYELPFGFTGMVRGYWAAANGAARVTEVV